MKKDVQYAFQATAEVLIGCVTAYRQVGPPNRSLGVVANELRAALAWERFGRGACTMRDVPEGAKESHALLRRVCGRCDDETKLGAFWDRVRSAVLTIEALDRAMRTHSDNGRLKSNAVLPKDLVVTDAASLCSAVVTYLAIHNGGRAMKAAQSPPK